MSPTVHGALDKHLVSAGRLPNLGPHESLQTATGSKGRKDSHGAKRNSPDAILTSVFMYDAEARAVLKRPAVGTGSLKDFTFGKGASMLLQCLCVKSKCLQYCYRAGAQPGQIS